jgi:hypothetical protein
MHGVYEGTFESDGESAIDLHVPRAGTSPGVDSGAGESGPKTDGATGGGELGALCSSGGDCKSGFCKFSQCTCDEAGHSKCPCSSAGASCGDDGECCSLSCGFDTDGKCD